MYILYILYVYFVSITYFIYFTYLISRHVLWILFCSLILLLYSISFIPDISIIIHQINLFLTSLTIATPFFLLNLKYQSFIKPQQNFHEVSFPLFNLFSYINCIICLVHTRGMKGLKEKLSFFYCYFLHSVAAQQHQHMQSEALLVNGTLQSYIYMES